MTNFLETLFSVILPSIVSGGVLGYVFERKRKKTELKLLEADFIKSMQEAYTKYVEDNQLKYNELVAENQKIIQQNKALLEENKALKLKIEHQSELVRKLSQSVTELKLQLQLRPTKIKRK